MSDFEQAIKGTLVRLRFHVPFFAVLSLFVKIVQGQDHQTDGFVLYLEPRTFLNFEKSTRDATILHLLLHAAFNHTIRRRARKKENWNVAADVVVNGIIASYPQFQLPDDAIRMPELEHLSVEEIYCILEQQQNNQLVPPDLLEPPDQADSGNRPAPGTPGTPGTENGQSGDENTEGSSQGGRPKNLQQYWKGAVGNAKVVAQQSKTQGTMPAGLLREFGLLTEPQIPWRDALARLVSRRPVDFVGFDRRFFSRGMYIDALDGISVTVDICIDTSGSISDEHMNTMLSEIQGILQSYPEVKARISYADAAVYGPYPFENWESLEPPKGGGGTNFCPFFDMLEREQDNFDPFGERIVIYLTDGYGTFPQETEFETVWVVIAGGADDDRFPFGTVLRLVD